MGSFQQQIIFGDETAKIIIADHEFSQKLVQAGLKNLLGGGKFQMGIHLPGHAVTFVAYPLVLRDGLQGT